MEEIPTAEEILELILKSQPEKSIGKEVAIAYIKTFVAMHVTSALQTASVYGALKEDTFGPEDILNCYPLDNIK